MISLRRAAFRVLSSSSSGFLQSKSQRSITSATRGLPCKLSHQRTAFLPLEKRRWASEDATQSEPLADGATEASYGDNSIAASADTTSNTNDSQNATREQDEGTAGEAVDQAKEKTSSAATTATETVQSATAKISEAAQSAKESVSQTAEGLGAAVGLGPDTGTPRNSTGEVREPKTNAPSKTVYVGNLFFDVRGEDLRREFERAGPIVDAKIILDQRGLSKGFGYVEFSTVEAATQAIQLYNQQNWEGRRLTVQYSLSTRVGGNTPRPFNGRTDRPLHSPTKTLFIGNMSFDMSDRDLNNLFREVKNVIDVRVAIDRRTGQPRGFAHADFMQVEDASKALEDLRGKVVCGRELRVDYSTSTGRAAMGAATQGLPSAEAESSE